jgi:malonyl-CoA/methylmalonyl-CoA synthetase
VQRDSDDLGALLYSSGTTGVPKGIMLTHGNLLSNTEALVEAWGFTDNDRLLHALPIFHVHGLFVAIGCVLLGGASMRWLSAYSPELAMRFLPECTVMMGVPTFYTRLLALEDFSANICENIRLFVSGSAPLLAETFAVEIRVVDHEGKVLSAGEIGDLQVRGANVFKGYWKMQEKTAEDFTDDGFFDTGDKAQVDTDGYVSIVGRSKDLVITGGLNVYPKEVELFLDTIPGVQESAVIGVPHADFGEAVVAIIVAEKGTTLNEESVIGIAKEGVANFKVPKRVMFIPELPRNTMAKVQKNILREAYSSLFAQ